MSNLQVLATLNGSHLIREPTSSPVLTKCWNLELILATNFGNLHIRPPNLAAKILATKFGFVPDCTVCISVWCRDHLLMHTANERQRYIVMSSLIGWAHTKGGAVDFTNVSQGFFPGHSHCHLGNNPGPYLNIKKVFPGIGVSIIKNKTVMRLSYLYNGNSYTGKMASIFWDGLLVRWKIVNNVWQKDLPHLNHRGICQGSNTNLQKKGIYKLVVWRIQ